MRLPWPRSPRAEAPLTPVVSPRPTSLLGRVALRLHDLARPSQPSEAWGRRTERAGLPHTFAETAEVQVAAYLYDVTLRVYHNDHRGQYRLAFTANPGGARGSVALVLQGMHYRWLRAQAETDTFAADGRLAHQICNVPPNGDCFYQCIADAVGHAPPSARRVRAHVVRALRGAENMPLDGAEGMTLGQAFG